MLRAPARGEAGPRPFPVVVAALSLVCAAVYLYSLTLDGAALTSFVERWGLLPREFLRVVAAGGPDARLLTPLTASFLHENLVHLGGNLFFLTLFGELLEVELGRARLLGLFCLAAVGASLVQLAVVPESFRPALGASGAVSGLLGGYVSLALQRHPGTREAWRPLGVPPGVFLAVWVGLIALATGQGGESYAVWAHLGGFAAGLGTCALQKLHR